MNKVKNYHIEKLSFLRKVVRASASVTKQKNVIHFFSEIDVSIPLKLRKDYEERTGKKLSFTGYLAKCFANIILRYPHFNTFISGNKQVIINDLNISILMERKIGAEYVPEPLVLNNVDNRTIEEITNEIREAQLRIKEKEEFGNLNENKIFKLIPGFLLKTFIKLADKNIKMGVKYAKLAITSVGMFGKNPFWIIPHGSATVLLSVGSMNEEKLYINGLEKISKKLCLTVSFDHDLIDGAPVARFMDELIEEIKSGNSILDLE